MPIEELFALRRNPQYLSERQNQALRDSIERDGFLCPIVIRKKKGVYEILSGNHRVIASRAAGLKKLPCCLVDPCDDKRAARIAVNMNTVHGEPTPELLAPFLAEVDDDTLRTLFLDETLLGGIKDFDRLLADRLESLELPDALNAKGNGGASIPNCVCKCGNRHVAIAPTDLRLSQAVTTRASKKRSMSADIPRSSGETLSSGAP